MIALLATAFISLGLVNLDVSRGWWRGQWPRLAIGVPLVALYVYETLPPLVFPQAFTLLLLTLVPNARTAGFSRSGAMDHARHEPWRRRRERRESHLMRPTTR